MKEDEAMDKRAQRIVSRPITPQRQSTVPSSGTATLPQHVKKNRGQQVTGGFAAEVAAAAKRSRLPK